MDGDFIIIVIQTSLSLLQDQLGAYMSTKGRGPRVVVSTAAFHARVRGSFPGLGGLKETKMFLPHPLVKLVKLKKYQ